MFLGTFTPKLLANGQVSLPAKIRSHLGGNKAVITTGFDRCLYGFSLPDWQKITQSELTRPLSTAEGRQIRRQIFANAQEIDLDSQGRFVLSETWRQFAGIRKNLVIIGAGDHFEIWDEGEWTKIQETGISKQETMNHE